MNDVRIYIEDNGWIDLTDDFAVSLNFSVAEIQDISQKNSSFSKTINVKGSQNNNRILGNLFNINIYDQSFDLNRRYKAKLYTNGTINFDGFIRLLDCKKVTSGKPNDEDNVQYSLQLIDDKYNFYSLIGDKLLEDCTMSAGNHYYTFSAITATTWSTADNSLYAYFMPLRNSIGNYRTTDFKPAIFAREYWSQIHEQAGFSYEISTEIDDIFKRLIIPFNGDSADELISWDEINRRKFRVGFKDYSPLPRTNLIYSGASNQTLILDNESGPTFFDNGNLYDVSTYSWTADRNGASDFSFSGIVDIYLHSVSGATLSNPSVGGLGQLSLQPRLILYKNGIPLQDLFSVLYYARTNGYTVNPGLNIFQTGVTWTGEWAGITHQPGDVFSVGLQSLYSVVGGFYSGSTLIATTPYLLFTSTTAQNMFYNTPHRTALSDGDLIYLDNYKHKNVKQKDFISSIIKMFNFYVEIDKENDKKLIYRTRDEFYDVTTYVDWTYKLDLSQEHTIQFLPELQSKELLFTYKEDKDFFNDNYKTSTGKIYSQQRVVFDNEYSRNLGEKKVELIFSPTPIVYNYLQQPLIVSAIDSVSPKNNIRILYKSDWIPGNWTYETVGPVVQYNMTSYPYAGHYDNPINPEIDISWGINDYLYYTNYGNLTDNTLYNNYYSRQISQILDGKLFTGMFKLESLDILNLDFRKKVFIKDAFYILNKIENYNPFGIGFSKVELMRVDDGEFFNRSTGTTRVIFSPGENYVLGNVDITKGGGNTNAGWGVDVVGVDNYVDRSSNASQIYGSGNTASGIERTGIFGDSNRVQATSGSFVVGSGNTVDGRNIYVFGNNISATTSDTTYATNVQIFSSFTINPGATIVLSGTSLGLWTSSTGSNSIIANNNTGNFVNSAYGNILGGFGNYIN